MLSASKEQRVERGELALFCRQFGGMLGAGVDLLGILDVLRKQSSNEKLKEVLDSVERDVSLGRLLSTAFGRFPEIFSPFFLSMLRQGERDDVLEAALIRIAEHLEREGEGGWVDSGDKVMVRSEVDFSLYRLWPLLFWQAVGTAIVCVAIASLWYATDAGLFMPGSLGPNVLLLIGLLVFVLSLVFARFGPVRALTCSFCGKTPESDEMLVKGRGAAICHECVLRNTEYIAQAAPPSGEAAAEELSPASHGESEGDGEEEVEVEVEDEDDLEEDLEEEPEFQIIKSSEDDFYTSLP